MEDLALESLAEELFGACIGLPPGAISAAKAAGAAVAGATATETTQSATNTRQADAESEEEKQIVLGAVHNIRVALHRQTRLSKREATRVAEGTMFVVLDLYGPRKTKLAIRRAYNPSDASQLELVRKAHRDALRAELVRRR